LMAWKLLRGNNSKSIWAHSCDELEGLNKDLASKFAKLKALQVKDIITATDDTRKDGEQSIIRTRTIGHKKQLPWDEDDEDDFFLLVELVEFTTSSHEVATPKECS
ncbi:hypothetical protein Tco_1322317, partial [Tanacetum coccineum]